MFQAKSPANAGRDGTSRPKVPLREAYASPPGESKGPEEGVEAIFLVVHVALSLLIVGRVLCLSSTELVVALSVTAAALRRFSRPPK